MHAREMIGTHPAVQGQINDALIRCIEECYSCAQTCTSCADACLSERMVQELTQCIRLDLDCADICNITGRIMTRRTGSDDEVMRRMLSVCAAACRLCAEECQKHAAMHEHCRICAESCRRCMEACQELARGMAHYTRDRRSGFSLAPKQLNWKLCVRVPRRCVFVPLRVNQPERGPSALPEARGCHTRDGRPLHFSGPSSAKVAMMACPPIFKPRLRRAI
jgi:hypothetical protein